MRLDQGWGSIVRAGDVSPAFQVSADVVIIGTGAGGSAALAELSRAGLRVVAVEAGALIDEKTAELPQEQALAMSLAESGARLTPDLGINVVQGRGVGGSTQINSAVCKRIPAEIMRDWSDRLGLEFPGLDDDYKAIEAALNVRTAEDQQINANNRVLLRGLEALDYRGGVLQHNRALDQSEGDYVGGSVTGGQRNTAQPLLTSALEAGAMILADARVDRILREGSKVTGVSGKLVDHRRNRDIGDFEIQADAVVLAASATSSAALHIASGLPDPYALAGRRLHLHPAAMVFGFHSGPIRGWEGLPQSVECTQFLDFEPGSAQRVWLANTFMNPALTAAMLPGFGRSHAELMRRYAFISSTMAMVHDQSSGYVRQGPDSSVRISYKLNKADTEQLALGLREATRLQFAGGAEQVIVPLRDPLVLTADSDLDEVITADAVSSHLPQLIAAHPMSTLWMGADAKTSVVSREGRHHHLNNLWVADGSLFPTSTGGPPQIGIYTFGHRVGRAVAASLSR